MGFPTKVQLIKRKASQQWYITFPSALAQAMDFVSRRNRRVVRRGQEPVGPSPPSSACPYSEKNSAPILSFFRQLRRASGPAFSLQGAAALWVIRRPCLCPHIAGGQSHMTVGQRASLCIDSC
jgi:hypothetical protein